VEAGVSEALLLAVGFIALLVLGAPVWLAIGAPALTVLLAFTTNPPAVLANLIHSSMLHSAFATIPLFLLAGSLMSAGGTSDHLIRFFSAFLRHVPGGLAVVSVMSCTFFAGLSGSSTADTAAIGRVTIVPMIRAGYHPRFATGLVAASGTLGIIIPPSIPMILYSVITGESTGKLFIAGIVPGLVIALMLLGMAIVVSRRQGYGREAAATWGERGAAFVRALPILGLPALILGALYGGWATTVEVAALAAVYAFVVGAFVYRSLSWEGTWKALRETARLTSAIALIIVASEVMSFVLTYMQAPQGLVSWVIAQELSPWLFLVAVNVVLLVLGLALEPPPVMFMTLPLLYPVVKALAIDPVHFGVLTMVNMQLAQVSPPIGIVLFIAAAVAKVPVQEVFRGVMPFIWLLLAALVLITYVPWFSLVLLGGRS
jgi:C4-dicarboxylate transporter DctM subunit